MDLTNKVALITGAAVRVGRAIAVNLSREGVKVGLHYHQSEVKARQVLAQITSNGGEGFLVKGDFSKVSEIQQVVDKCYEHFKNIHILVNNAALYFRTPFGETTEKQWDELLTVNLKAPFFCAQYVAEIMKRQKEGKIINVADVAAILPWSGYIPYCASKAGLIGLTKGLAKALAPHIQVNAVAPGTVLMGENATEEEREAIENLTLLKRIGTPEDVVNAILFLLKGSDYVTGTVIAVDGGRLLV